MLSEEPQGVPPHVTVYGGAPEFDDKVGEVLGRAIVEMSESMHISAEFLYV